MPRYFIEVFYKGTRYSGFQVQQNANSIQAEMEKALNIFFRSDFTLTGSSRTDTGVHAYSNYFHFDSAVFDAATELRFDRIVYNLNAILPDDIVVKRICRVADEAHCRFDARARHYQYSVYQQKDPFLADRAYYYPYPLDIGLLNEAAAAILSYEDFTSFSKRNTQVGTFQCDILSSEWSRDQDLFVYRVSANRFLRGMVRGLVGTMLKVGTGKMSIKQFHEVVAAGDSSKADFSVPPQGLFLMKVVY